MHSLLNASTLGFDLLRRPGGAEVGALLATALGLVEGDLPDLAAAHQHDADRTAAWAQVIAIESSAPTMRVAMRDAVALCADPERYGAATRLLERTAIGNLDGLLRCIRTDIFDWTWDARGAVALRDEQAARAVSVVCDAAAGGYHDAGLPAAAVRRLRAGWVTAGHQQSHPVTEAGPADDPVGQLLGRLRRLDATGRQDLRTAAARAARSGMSWAEDMHEATWAVHLSGRVRDAAGVQLQALQPFERAGLGAADAAAGVWNLVSGALQGLVVRDLVDDGALERLVDPVEPVLGPFAA
jgi:hypothetical protein